MNKDSVAKYIEKLEKLFKQHNILQRLLLIQEKLQICQGQERQKKLFMQLNALDKQRVALMILAEKYAGKRKNLGFTTGH